MVLTHRGEIITLFATLGLQAGVRLDTSASLAMDLLPRVNLAQRTRLLEMEMDARAVLPRFKFAVSLVF